MNPILIFAQQMIQRNQNNIPNTPWAQAAVSAIMNGDEQAGSQIADNLCQSYGMTREEALNKAKQSIKLPFNR